ncbi:MAG: hypothetical protein QW117_00150 [Candidatus Pacearchaeota archaeon]
MKQNLEKAIQKFIITRNYEKLEDLRKKSISNQDPLTYKILCDELGIIELEDKFLYDLGTLIEEEKRYKKNIKKISKYEKHPYYPEYNIPKECPEDFFEAFDFAKQVKFKERIYQELVRGIRGPYYKTFFEFYNPKTKEGISKMRKYLKNKFPKNKKEINSLDPKKIIHAYYSIRGVWG